jgi:hypothetical protein
MQNMQDSQESQDSQALQNVLNLKLEKIPMRPRGYYSPPQTKRELQNLEILLDQVKLQVQERQPPTLTNNIKFLDLDVAYLIAVHIEKLKVSRKKKDSLYPVIHKKIYEHAKQKNIFTFSDFQITRRTNNNHKSYLEYFSQVITSEICRELNC